MGSKIEKHAGFGTSGIAVCNKYGERILKRKKHASVYFSYQLMRKRCVIHVPHEMFDYAYELNKNWQELKDIILS